MPIYERPENEQNEDYVLGRLKRAWGVSFVRCKRLSICDALAIRDDVIVALIEIKEREKFWPTMFLDEYKAERMVQMADWLQCEPLHVFNVDGDIRWWRINIEDAVEIKVTGRTDRADKNDQRPAWEIPLEKYHRLAREHETAA